MAFERILIPTDGSQAASDAAEEGLELAAELGSEVVVVSVVESDLVDATFAGGGTVEEERVEKLAHDSVDEVAERADEMGVPAETVVVKGVPHEEILNVADEHGCDCIVIGTHGRGGLERALLGSIADRVVRTSPVPVVTVRPE